MQLHITPAQQGAKTFGNDQFDIDYVLGRIEITNQTPQNWTDFTIVNVGWNQNQDRHDQLTFNNTSRSNNIYIDHYNQAFYKGESYGIREYVWLNKGTGGIQREMVQEIGMNVARAIVIIMI